MLAVDLVPTDLPSTLWPIAALFAPTIAVIVSAYLAGKSAKAAQQATVKAQADAALAQQATLRAQEDAAKAQRDAAQAAEHLVRTAQNSNAKLDHIVTVTTGTHELVNNQHTILKELVATMARRIADDNPDDVDAQGAADVAEKDAFDARAAQNQGIGRMP